MWQLDLEVIHLQMAFHPILRQQVGEHPQLTILAPVRILIHRPAGN